MADLPTGTITFLFTDVEGSTTLWEQQPVTMRQALMHHDAMIEAAVEQCGGTVVRPRGETEGLSGSRWGIAALPSSPAPVMRWLLPSPCNRR